MKIKTVSILGAGSWGTTLAIVLSSKKDLQIRLWSPFRKQIRSIKKTGYNKGYLDDVRLPKRILLTNDLAAALASELIIVAIPTAYLRGILKKIQKTRLDCKGKIFLSVVKGIETEGLKTPSQIIHEELGLKAAVLSGPTIAKEVVRKVPTVATIASRDERKALRLQEVFKGTALRTYRSRDLFGTELAAAVKNIIAIACGISDGLGFGTNTKAALVTRGVVEMARLGSKLRARPATFWGISGIGDLVTTCFSPYSRNRFVGEEIGRGKSLKKVINRMTMIAEGVDTVRSVYRLSKRTKVDMPITNQVYSMLYRDKDPRRAVKDLMSRPLKAE